MWGYFRANVKEIFFTVQNLTHHLGNTTLRNPPLFVRSPSHYYSDASCGRDVTEAAAFATSLAANVYQYTLRRFPSSAIRSAPQRPLCNMMSQWVIWLLISGVAYVSGSPCDHAHATKCFSDFVHYESQAFPLYGEDAAKLANTCENISISFNCVNDYIETCNKNPECDDECRSLINEARSVITNSGLRKLAAELCTDDSPFRETYLENYNCLENNADVYSVCYNNSQMSLDYIKTIDDSSIIEITCCYFSWYKGCYENITRENCGMNATVFISTAVGMLVNHISDKLCTEVHISCERPPSPPTVNDENDENDDNDENELAKEEPDRTNDGLGNSTIDASKGSATVTNHVVVLVLSFCFVLLSKWLL